MTIQEIIDQYPNAIIAICYGTAHVFNTTASAKRFFNAAMNGSDGCEADRYATIHEKLSLGWTVASDDEDIFYAADELSTKVQKTKIHGRINSK